MIASLVSALYRKINSLLLISKMWEFSNLLVVDLTFIIKMSLNCWLKSVLIYQLILFFQYSRYLILLTKTGITFRQLLYLFSCRISTATNIQIKNSIRCKVKRYFSMVNSSREPINIYGTKKMLLANTSWNLRWLDITHTCYFWQDINKKTSKQNLHIGWKSWQTSTM